MKRDILPFLATACFLTPTTMSSPILFELRNETHHPRTELVRVSLPIAQGSARGEPSTILIIGQAIASAQARVITFHPDGSARRVMLSFPVTLPPGAAVPCRYDPGAKRPPQSVATPVPLLAKSNSTYIGKTAAYTLVIDRDRVRIQRSGTGQRLGDVRAYGPTLSNPQHAQLSVIENGEHFAWLRWQQHGEDYGREVDIQIDRLGRLTLTQRIIRHLRENGWTPDFGFQLVASGAEAIRLPDKPVGFLELDPESCFAEKPELVASLKLADGQIVSMTNSLALRQQRGRLSAQDADGSAKRVCVSRIQPVEDENNRLMIQEGMWRVVRTVIQPGSGNSLMATLDRPVIARTDWRAYDAVYHTGPPLKTQNPVLRGLVERGIYVLQELSINGDDWGNMTSYSPSSDKAAINSMVRYNHCQYVWEDYFRTGDPRLRRVALDWSENYRNFSVYWGPEKKYYGGSRRGRKYRDLPGSPHGPGTYMVRFNNAVHFCTKGYHSFWLAYEETGDPRFKEAAEAQAKWSATHVHANTGEMRNVGMITDYAKLYSYTRDPSYLDQALRLWREFSSRQCPDLLFTQHGKPATGNDLYIRNDQHGYRNPFYKPYMVQYVANSLPYLLRLRPDDKRLRDTIAACADWMSKVQTPGGGWGYPGTTTAGLGWGIEYCHGLMLAHRVQPNEAYLDAVHRSLGAVVALFAKYGCLSSGITAWEYVQNQRDTMKTYELGTDRDRLKDFTHGKVKFGSSPDSTVYLQVLLRDYLRHRGEASLLSKDKFIEQILHLPTYLPKDRSGGGDPWLGIKITHHVTPKGMRVRFAAVPKGRLRRTSTTYRWTFPDGATQSGAVAERTFPAAGRHEVRLQAIGGASRRIQTAILATPTGPADIGLARWPEGVRVQAEAFSDQGGTDRPVQIWHDRKGADGAAFSHWDKKGHWLEWAFDVATAGEYYMLVKYARPGDGARSVHVDGREVASMRLGPTGGYTLRDQDDYAVELLRDKQGTPIRLKLAAGVHTLRMINTDGQGCNLDYIEFFAAPAK